VHFSTADLMLGKLMLIVSELGEYIEAPDARNTREELADAGIRVLHVLAALKVDIDAIFQDGLRGVPETLFVIRQHITALIVTLSRAAEACRHHELNNFVRYLGYTFYILNYMAEQMGFDLIVEIEKKMEVNRGRPYLHGKKSAT
jgi:NTP pyrophosphatase (non-canonical NTP hydrolase)